MIRVLLVDDQPLIRTGLRALLDAEDDLEVVAEAEHGEAAVELAAEHHPDLVLMDVQMPVLDGIEATRRIVGDERLADVRVVVLTNYGLDEYVFDALRAGASGFLVKDTEPEEIVQALRVVADGDALLSPGITRRLISEFVARPAEVVSAATLDAADRTRTGGRRARRQRAEQRRDRRAPRRQPDHGEDAREPGDDQDRCPEPRAARRARVRVGTGPSPRARRLTAPHFAWGPTQTAYPSWMCRWGTHFALAPTESGGERAWRGGSARRDDRQGRAASTSAAARSPDETAPST